MAKKAKFIVRVGASIQYEAGSIAALLQRIKEDETAWSVPFQPPHRISNSGLSFAPNYPGLRHAVEAMTEAAPELDLTGRRDAAFYPSRLSLEGMTLQSLVDHGEKETTSGLLLHWWAKNKWIDSAFSDVRTLAGPLQRLGMSVLANTLVQTDLPQASLASKKLESASEELQRALHESEAKADALERMNRDLEAKMHRLTEHAERRHEAYRRLTSAQARRAADNYATEKTNWNSKWDQTHETFLQRLTLSEPVELWKAKAKEHRTAASNAFLAFMAASGLTAIFALVMVTCFGTAIGEAFNRTVCTVNGECTDTFSFRGPLTVGAILLVASLLIWIIRFQARIYLSERYLALSAEERKAFTQAYLALSAHDNVSTEHQAIVLAALFRPSQDGVIKDDDHLVDISAAAILAKAMAGPRAS